MQSYLNLIKLACQTLLSLSRKLAKMAMNLVSKKTTTMNNFLHEENIHFFVEIKSLYTINNLCMVIEIIAS